MSSIEDEGSPILCTMLAVPLLRLHSLALLEMIMDEVYAVCHCFGYVLNIELTKLCSWTRGRERIEHH